MKIFKYRLPSNTLEVQEIQLPKTRDFLKFALDAERQPSMWLAVDPNTPLESVKFQYRFTGQDTPESGCYLGLVVVRTLVYHLYLIT